MEGLQLQPATGPGGAAKAVPPYDVFLSYSHQDREWVEAYLLKRLEAEGIRVLIDDRDFLIGDYSVTNMERAVASSRHTLAVLTPDWVESRWTAFESLLAATANPLDRKLLPLMLKPCKPPDRIAALTYADFREPSRREAELAKLLRSIAVTASPPEPIQGEPAGRGLVALADLMQEPEVRDAVVAFRIHFERVCDQIGIAGAYKELHDLLHSLQLHGFDRIVQEAKRFPDDDVAIDNLREHETTLRGIINDLRRVEHRAKLPSGDLSWIDKDLEPAVGALQGALEAPRPRGLERTILLLRRVLTYRPSEINTQMRDAARNLPLSALIKVMTTIRDRMRKLDLDPEKVQQFETGIKTLDRLGQTLDVLVADHDRWQEAEQELRLTEDTWNGALDVIDDYWSRIRDALKPMTEGNAELWAAPFRKQSQQLSEAIAAQDPERARKCFRSFRREASIRFHEVDLMLKDQCDELQKVAEPLASLLRRIES